MQGIIANFILHDFFLQSQTSVVIFYMQEIDCVKNQINRRKESAMAKKKEAVFLNDYAKGYIKNVTL